MIDSTPITIALVTAKEARNLDEDLQPLELALQQIGALVEIAEWDDVTIDWSTFDAAVLRSTWDYSMRLPEFISWAEKVSTQTTLLNPLPILQWNIDKHYLAVLARANVPTVFTEFVEPHDDVAEKLSNFLTHCPTKEIVVKPAIGSGSRDAQRHSRRDMTTISEHVERLVNAKRSVMLQPYLDRVDEDGETALIFYNGRFSHAIRKGPLLRSGEGPTEGLFAPEEIEPRVPDSEQLRVAEQAVAAIPFPTPLYARVDLIRDNKGAPCVLELELMEPSMFFAHAKGSADRFAAAIHTLLRQ